MKRCLILLVLGIVFSAGLTAQDKKLSEAKSEKGLAGYWSFDEGKGSITKDYSGNGNHGEINGAKWVKGMIGNALEFNGSDAYVDCGNDNTLNITEELTVEAWVKPLKADAYQRGIVEKSITAGYTGWSLYQTNNSVGYYFRVALSDGTLKGVGTGTGTIVVDTWIYLVGVKDAKNIYIYINGELTGSTPVSLPIASNNESVKIGWYGYMRTGDVYFNGLVDEVKIYNRVLTKEEIKRNYEEKIKIAGAQKIIEKTEKEMKKNDGIKVAIYNASKKGGRSYGHRGISDFLGEQKDISAELIGDLSLKTLLNYDVLILPNVQQVGKFRSSEYPETSVYNIDWRANIRAFAELGRGVLLTDSVGGRHIFEKYPLFPDIVRKSKRIVSTGIVNFASHPCCEGLDSFEHSFSDHMALELGDKAIPLLWDKDGNIVAASGEFGKGRVIASGMCTGIDASKKEQPPSGGEAKFLLNAIKFLAKGERSPKCLLITPYFFKITPEVDEKDREIPSLNVLWMDSEKSKQNILLKIIDEKDAVIAENKFVLTANEPQAWEIPNQKISDGKYRIEAEINKKSLDEPVGIIEVSDFYWARLTDSLPRANFERRTLHCHVPGALQTPEEVREMVRRAKAMGFTDIYFNLKITSGSVYYSSKIGYPAPVVSKFDPFAIAVEESKKQNIRIIAYFCVFNEDRNAPFLKEHPDWVEVDKGEPSDYRKQKDIFGCPDRPEVREFELSLMREVLTNYQVDGIALDYIRYKNDYACYCDYSQKTLREYMNENPGLGEKEAREKRAEETIVGMTVSIRNLIDSMKKGLTLSAYVHPIYAYKFPLDYHSRRASAHGNDPERGGEWSLEKVHNEAKFNVELAKKSPYSYQKPAPMADTAYRNWAKSSKRFQREIRLIKYAGANDIDIYLYDTLRFKPELRKMIAEEFGGNPEEAVK